MKIYNKLVLDINTFEVIEEDSFEYDGPIAHCGSGGGGSTTTTVDPVYNARMAALSERQQAMAEDYFKFYKEYQQPIEKAQLEAQMGMIPEQVQLAKSTIATQQQGLQYQQSAIAEAQKQLDERSPVVQSYYKQALEGVNVNQRMDEAGAEASRQFKGVTEQTGRSLARAGVDPNSGRGLAALTGNMMGQSRAIAGTRQAAGYQAEAENFARLQAAAGMGSGVSASIPSVGGVSAGGGLTGYGSTSGTNASAMASQLMGQATNLGTAGTKTEFEEAAKSAGGAIASTASMSAAGAMAAGAMYGEGAGPYGAIIGGVLGLGAYLIS